jgi:tetratricopeptide (TPR) repeat protein
MPKETTESLEVLTTSATRNSRRRTLAIICLGVLVALLGLATTLWSAHKAMEAQKVSEKLATTQAALQTAKANEAQTTADLKQVDSLIANGAQLAHIGQFAAAAKSYDLALKIEPENADALQFRGYLALRQGDTASAIRMLRQATANDPKGVWGHYNLAIALFRSGDTDGTVEQVTELLQTNPEFKATIMADAQFAKIRQDPRIKALLAATKSNEHAPS